MDNDGFVTQHDIEQVLKMMIGPHIISPEDLTRIAAETITECDKTGDGKVSLEEFYDFMYNNAELPEKSFLLTFDDGIRTSWKYADPVLKALDYKAVMFIITSTSAVDGSVYYLSRDEVEKMIESGRWKIQSHGHEAHFLIPIDVFYQAMSLDFFNFLSKAVVYEET